MKKNEGRVRAFAVKVVRKRLPVSPFSGLLKGCKGHKTHRFENGGTHQIRKTGSRFPSTFTANALCPDGCPKPMCRAACWARIRYLGSRYTISRLEIYDI